MKCIVCKEEVDMFNVDLGEGLRVHLSCFFDKSIPNPPSKTDVNFELLNKERETAINNRIKDIKASI